MQYDKVYSFMVNKLETGLPNYIIYHNAPHTISVISAAEQLGKAENISAEDMLLLKTAALFHDSGFLQHHDDHEEFSCKIATKYLPDFGYTPEQIDHICQMIRATKLPQSPADHLAKILCDADLHYLGGEHYLANAEKLFTEYKKLGSLKTQAEWDLQQAEFLSNHRYFTDTAINLFEQQKQNILAEIEVKIAATMSVSKTGKTGELIQDIFFILFGILLSGIAINFFLLPNQLIDGGITGIYLLIQGTHHVSSLLIIPLNLPFIILSYFTVSKRFAIWTFICIVLLGLCLFFLHNIHVNIFSNDKLLMSIFGGIFLGIGIGLVMRAGAALDGIEVLALYTLKRTSFTITEIILGINIIIFSIAAYVFSIETALYSILTYFAATRCIDYVVEGIQAYTGVTIISGKSEVIKYQLVNNLGRGITIYKGERGFLPGKFEVSSDCDIIFTVINRLELRKLKNLVYKSDPRAFVFASTIKEASGGIIKRRHKH
ncbi:hypothetical protein BH09BAC6_BH09BAC6_03830 [soil metagenome]